MIDLQALNMAELLAYTESAAYREASAIAISPHRAKSQAANPHLLPTDTVMILARQEGELLGYLGSVPDEVVDADGQTLRFGWLSCLWVAPEARGQRLTQRMLTLASERWDGALFLGEYVPFLVKVYRASGYFMQEPLDHQGIRLYMLSDLAHLLPPKAPAFAKIRPVLQAADAAVNMLLRPRLALLQRFGHGKAAGNITLEHLTALDPEARAFIDIQREAYSLNHGADHMEWLMHHPWILPLSRHEPLFDRYHFSATAREFATKLVGLRDARGSLCALMLFTLRDGHLRLPYLFANEDMLPAVADAVHHCICLWRVRHFSTYQPGLVKALAATKTPALYKKALTRNYMIAPRVYEAMKPIRLQDGDGDIGFT